MSDLTTLEKRIAEIEKQQRGLTTKKNQLKSRLSAEKRKQENHCKMVLGGAVYGYVKEDLPEDRKDLELYGWALKAAIEEDPNFLGAVRRNYERLKADQAGDVGGSTNEGVDEDQVSLFDNEGN